MVSVIVPFRNAAAFLAETIRSVVRQTYQDWELILVDDGSTDDGPSIVREFGECDERIHSLDLCRSEPAGASIARNAGLEIARGNVIAFLDADDVWLPYKLDEQVRILYEVPEASMLYGQTEYWWSWAGDGRSDFIPETSPEPWQLIEPPELLLRTYPLGAGNAPGFSSVAILRAALERIGGFEAQLSRSIYEDQVFLAKVYLSEHVLVADRLWDRYRQHEESVSAAVERDGSYWKARLTFLRWLERYLAGRPRVDGRVQSALGAALFLAGARDAPPTSVSEVEYVKCDPAAELLGANMELPQVGRLTVRDLAVSGWVLGRVARATYVSFEQGGKMVGSIPVGRARSDIEAAFPQTPGAALSGFSGSVNGLLLKQGELHVRAVLADGTLAEVGSAVLR